MFHVTGGTAPNHYLKIGVDDSAELVRREMDRTDWLVSVGIRVPIIVARFIDKDVAAALMTDLGSRTAEHIRPSGWHAAISNIGRVFADLHSIPVEACPFDETLGVRLSRANAAVRSGCVDPSHFNERNRGTTPDELYERLVANVPEREDRVITHGDATLSNLILTDHGQVGLVDCSHVGMADRYVDLALVVAGLEERFGTDALAAFSDGYGALSWESGKAEFYLDLYELF